MNLCPQIQAPDPKAVKLSGYISEAQATQRRKWLFQNCKMGSTSPAGRSENSTEKGKQDTERMEASRRETSATRSQEQGIKDECQQEAKTKNWLE